VPKLRYPRCAVVRPLPVQSAGPATSGTAWAIPMSKHGAAASGAASDPAPHASFSPPPGASVCSIAYWRFRVRNTALRKFVEGRGLSSTDADSAVNTLTLVSALGKRSVRERPEGA
jgi:hypothetical protein